MRNLIIQPVIYTPDIIIGSYRKMINYYIDIYYS
jgi:hypothetical protein